MSMKLRKTIQIGALLLVFIISGVGAVAAGNGNTCSPTNNKASCKPCPPPRGNPSPGTPKSNPPCP
jgi:hypothetical protein